MERKPSRVDAFLERDDDLDCAGELIRLARSAKIDSLPEGAAEEVIFADTRRLARELTAEYAALCDAMAKLRR